MEPPRLDLWVKAGSDGMRNGGCPVCQQIFMILLSKCDLNVFEFNVKTTSLAKPHPDFKAAGLRHVPALVNGSNAIFDTPDEIIEYIDLTFPANPLQYAEVDVDAAIKDVFSKFCWFIKEVNKDPNSLEAELLRMDAFLRRSETVAKGRFLAADKITHADCQMLPKLHHIRIAADYLKGFKIPLKATGIWRYLKNAYESEIFTKSCPSDQEIILHWADRADTKNLDKTVRAQLTNEVPKYNFEVPSA